MNDYNNQVIKTSRISKYFGRAGLCQTVAALLFCTALQVSADPVSPTLPTGIQTSIAAGDDGAVQAGATIPAPRFHDQGNGTVLDRATGLIWLADAGCLTSMTWADAVAASGTVADGLCGLQDGSTTGQWRLPNANELMSIIDYGQTAPALSVGHPFLNVQTAFYWSSSTLNNVLDRGRAVDLDSGRMDSNVGLKTNLHFVWLVRDAER